MPRRHRRSPITDFRLVPVDPQQDRKRFLWLAGGALAILIAGIVIGVITVGIAPSVWKAHHADKLDAMRAKLDAAHQQLAVYQTDKTIATKARGKVQANYTDLQNQLAELKKAVHFYKRLMDPAHRQQGLHIEHLSIYPSGEHQFSYRLVLTQVGNNKWRPYLKGHVSWQLQGQQQGKPVTLAQGVFVNRNSDTDFRFRYFQQLNGSLELPEGVRPTNVIITATSKGQRHYRAEHTFKWTNVEHENHAGS